MANFDLAVQKTLKFEGGYTDNEFDPGGSTKYGITLKVLQELGKDFDSDGDTDKEDVKLLPLQEAKDIYKTLYWNGDLINSQNIAEKNFDMGVNMGVITAAKYLQQACVACGNILTVDGHIGNKSIQAINSCDPKKLMDVLCQIQINHYWNIINSDVKTYADSRNWPKDLKESLLVAISKKDQASASHILAVLRKNRYKEGKLVFLNGWLFRANDRFGL